MDVPFKNVQEMISIDEDVTYTLPPIMDVESESNNEDSTVTLELLVKTIDAPRACARFRDQLELFTETIELSLMNSAPAVDALFKLNKHALIETFDALFTTTADPYLA